MHSYSFIFYIFSSKKIKKIKIQKNITCIIVLLKIIKIKTIPPNIAFKEMPDKTNNYIISTLENDGILSSIRSRLKLNILNILSDKYPKYQKYNDEKKEKVLSSELNMASLSFAFDLLKTLGLNLTNSLLLTEINSDKIYYERNSLAAKFGLQLSDNEPLLYQVVYNNIFQTIYFLLLNLSICIYFYS